MAYSLTLSLTIPSTATMDAYWTNTEFCQLPLFVIDGNNFTSQYTEVKSWMTSVYGGTCDFIVSGDTVTFTLTTDTDPSTVECGLPTSIVFELTNDGDTIYRSGAWSLAELTQCPTCQDLAITDCGSVGISLPLPDDDYTVTLYDNQSGVAYTQNVQWTSGTGTWNTTNTAGVFTPFSIYTLTVTDSQGEPVSWPVGPNEYTCARVTFSATVDTNSDG